MTKKIFIIAEAGVNHNGSIVQAKKLIDIAKEAGADAVKFQTFKAESLVSIFAPKADYQKKATSRSESQFEMLKKLELPAEAHRDLIAYCRRQGITFLSTPFDSESVELLQRLGLQIFKIPSGEITNLPHLKQIGALRKRVILSSGMATLKEIKDALAILTKAGTSKANITVLHCNTEYPTPMEDVNLSAMITIRDALQVAVGYSDHTLGIEVPIAATAMGAEVIEKHFTLDQNMEGPDHKASLSPSEFKSMVGSIRNIEKALGSSVKSPSPSEKENIVAARKSIVAARNIARGEPFTSENVTVKRPGGGVSPMLWNEVLGKKAKTFFRVDELIRL